MRIRQKVLLPLLAMLIVLAGCTSDSSTEDAASEPIVQTNTADDDGGQEITLVEPEEGGSANQYEEYVVQTRLTEMHLFDGKTGMAWGLTRSALRMYLTENNGKNWTPLSPSEQVTFSNVPEYGKEIFFTDTKHGWIVRSAGIAEETLVLRTSDGGENWALATLGRTDELPVALSFSDNDRGWLLTTKTSSTAGREDKTLYRTLDGGESWNTVMRTASDFQPSGSGNPLPDIGYVSGIHFESNGSGYATMLELGRPALYRTKDAGRNWFKSSSFFAGEENPIGSCDAYVSGKPQAYETSAGSWVAVGCKQRDNVQYHGYFTQNNGVAWTHVAFKLPVQESLNLQIAPVFTDRLKGWIPIGSQFYRTTDGGQNWKALPKNDKLVENMEKYPEIFQVQFVDDQVGWLLIGKTELRRSLLLQTLDGGVTWHVI
ncbi:VPS10 domain-containing protein [Saccharibacillus sacchari]|uniref:VPS10 domain-containing protein n=1 Tax=Saccharibacillus sacchari TaxID=456493 RepID=UPI0004B42AB1|nr:YCF48-related protein [Saccharibacillus sacchari]